MRGGVAGAGDFRVRVRDMNGVLIANSSFDSGPGRSFPCILYHTQGRREHNRTRGAQGAMGVDPRRKP